MEECRWRHHRLANEVLTHLSIGFGISLEPMDVCERVKKEHFWNEVFSQLKQCLKGSLHKYNVPLQNCFMSLEEMKTRFFSTELS